MESHGERDSKGAILKMELKHLTKHGLREAYRRYAGTSL